jgi:phospholipase/carboxylesterase
MEVAPSNGLGAALTLTAAQCNDRVVLWLRRRFFGSAGWPFAMVLLRLVLWTCPAESAPSRSPLKVESEPLAGIEYATFKVGTDDGSPLPLLVVLHSMGDGPEEFAPLFGRLSVPARVLLPRGTDHAFGGFAWWPASAYASPKTDADAVAAVADRLASFIAAARAHFGADRVVVTGTSQGGDLSFALALHHSDQVRAALPIAGRVLKSPDIVAKQAIVIDAFHGTADSKAPYARTAAAVELLGTRGIAAVLHTYPGLDHDVSALEETDLLACVAKRMGGNADRDSCRSPSATKGR